MRSRLSGLAFGLALAAALITLRVADPYAVRTAREIAFDQYQRLSPAPPLDLPVAIVDVDEASLAALGQWPWPRSRLAALTRHLFDLGAAVVAFDILFAEPDRLSPARLMREPDFAGLEPAPGAANLPDTDAMFAAAIAGRPVVLGFAASLDPNRAPPPPRAGLAVTGMDPLPGLPRLAGATRPIPVLEEAAAGLGSISLKRQDSGVVREVPLLWTDGSHVYPSLSIEALRLALQAPTIVLVGASEAAGMVRAVRIGTLAAPTASDGGFRIRYARDRPDRLIPAMRVLAGDDALRAAIEGAIVLIGTSAPGLADLRTTPLGEQVPGVAIHARIIEQILSGISLRRPDWLAGLEILVLTVASLAIVFAAMQARPLAGVAVALGLACAWIAGGWLAFSRYDLLLDPGYGFAAAIVLGGAVLAFRYLVSDRERRHLRRAFAHYVAPSVLDAIERSPDRLALGGQTRRITVLFADIRNFTARAQHRPPTEVVDMLNRLFDRLGRAITAELGTIDKYAGDSVMAFWNAPTDVPDHARRAVRAALAMRTAARMFAAEAGETDLDISVGIATGEACVGNLGSRERFDYSAVGDTVNLASRLEGLTRAIGYDIVVAEETAAELGGFALLDAGAVSVRGRSGRQRIFIVIGAEAKATDAAFLRLAALHERLMQTLARGADAGPLATDCGAAAAGLDPRLVEFYQRIGERAGDFAATA